VRKETKKIRFFKTERLKFYINSFFIAAIALFASKTVSASQQRSKMMNVDYLEIMLL